MRILTSSIASLIAPCFIGRPSPAFGEGDAQDTPDTQLGLDDKVSGEEPADFSFIQEHDEPPAKSPAAPSSPPEPKKAAEEPPAPARPAVADPNDEEPIPAVKPETSEQEVPDPKDEADKAKADKKATDDKAAADKKAADDKAATDKAAADKSKEVKLPTMEEVDAMQPKPGAPIKVVESFQKLKNEVVKPALARVRELEEELSKRPALDLEKLDIDKLPEPLKNRLTQADEDRKWREAFDAENDPVVRKELEEKVGAAEDGIIKLFTEGDKRLRMTPNQIEILKKQGWDSEFGQKDKNAVVAAVQKMNDPFLLKKVMDAFIERDKAIEGRQARLEELRSGQGALQNLREEREKTERIGWAGTVDQHIVENVKEDPIFIMKKHAEGETEAEKAAIDAHNEELEKKVVPQMHEAIRSLWSRDPEKGIKYAIASIRLPKIEAERDAARKELEAAQKRIAELEGDGKRMKRITAPTRQTGAPPESSSSAKVDTSDMKAEDAVDAYRMANGLHPGNATAK